MLRGFHTKQWLFPSEAVVHSVPIHCLHNHFQQIVIVIKVIATKYAGYLRGSRVMLRSLALRLNSKRQQSQLHGFCFPLRIHCKATGTGNMVWRICSICSPQPDRYVVSETYTGLAHIEKQVHS